MVSQLIEEFIYDAREHLNIAGNQLMRLEKNPSSLDDLNDLAGTIHTIKGNSGFLDFKCLYSLLHSAESILQTIRGQLPLFSPPGAIDLMFQVMDTVEAIVFRLENGLDDQVDWLPELNRQLKDLEAALENRKPPSAKTPPEKALPAAVAERQNPAPPRPGPSAAPPLRPQGLTLNQQQLENNGLDQLKLELTRLLAQPGPPVVVNLGMIDSLSRAGLTNLVELRTLAPGRIVFSVTKSQLANYQRLWRLMDFDEVEEIVAAE